MQHSDVPEFEELRQALQADGADLALDDVRDGTALVRLIVGPETCLDCIMPKPILEEILLASFRSAGQGGVSRVELDDPRLA